METRITVGLDMGDKSHSICVLDPEGTVTERAVVANTAAAIRKRFGGLAPCLNCYLQFATADPKPKAIWRRSRLATCW